MKNMKEKEWQVRKNKMIRRNNMKLTALGEERRRQERLARDEAADIRTGAAQQSPRGWESVGT